MFGKSHSGAESSDQGHSHACSPKVDGEDGDMTDMLGELRVLLPASQLLTAFLVTVPFAPSFNSIAVGEKHVFLATFLLSLVSLVLLSAPAVQHRLLRPLCDRPRFKTLASREMLVGACTLGVALVLVCQLVLSAVFDHFIGNVAAAGVATVIVLLWIVVPWVHARSDNH